MMGLARFSLGATSLAFFIFGFWLLIAPEALAKIGIQLANDSAKVEIRAMYGGFEIGMGVFFLLAAMRPEWFRPALVLQVVSLLGLGGVRLVTLLMAPDADRLLYLFAGLELVAVVIGYLALRRLPAGTTA
jgi:hypothetical protein